MKKTTILIFVYPIYLVFLTLVVDKLPYYLWSLFEKIGIDTYGIGMCITTLLFIMTLMLFTVFGGYIVLRQLIKSESESRRFWGIFLLCLVILVSAFNIWQADIPGIIYKTTKYVKIYLEPNEYSAPTTISRDVLGDVVDADFKYGNFLEFEPGSYLHKALNLESDTKLYLPEVYARSYSYTIG